MYILPNSDDINEEYQICQTSTGKWAVMKCWMQRSKPEYCDPVYGHIIKKFDNKSDAMVCIYELKYAK